MADVLSTRPGGRRGGRGRRRARGEDGIGMAMTMALVAIVFALGAVWLSNATHSTDAAGHERRRQQAIDAANAGLVTAAASLGKSKDYSGSPLTDFAGGSARYRVTVTNDGTDPSGLTKVIDSVGYAPNETAPQRAARTMRQVVKLVPQLGAGTFPYAIQSEQGIKTGSASSIVGDIYANQSIDLGNSQTIAGNVFGQGNVRTGSNLTVTGDIWAKGAVDLASTSSRVNGSVTSQGNITLRGRVDNNAVATGSIDNCARVARTCQQYTQVEAPPQQDLPTFTYQASNYPGLVTYASGGDMVTALANKTFSGAHYADSGPTFSKNHTWYLTGDTTILVKGSITLPGRIVNQSASGGIINLRVISTQSGDIVPSNNLTIPATIYTLLYGGKVGSSSPSNSIDLTGAVAALDLSLGANLKVTHQPVTTGPGFTFTTGQVVTSYAIRHVSTAEVATA